MARKDKITKEDLGEVCPVKGCLKKYGPRKGLMGIAMHIAMKRDKEHEEWRKEHDLPVDYMTRGEAEEIAKKGMDILE